MERGIARWNEYVERLAMLQGVMTDGPEPNPIMAKFFEIFGDLAKSVVKTAEAGEPLLSSWYGNGNEIYGAMGLPYYCPVDFVLAMQPFTDDIATSHGGPTPEDTCGLLRQAAVAVSEGLVPTPTQIVAMLEPCDGQLVLHELWQKTPEWRDIPVFALDHPYGSRPEDYRYFAGELRRMADWLEAQTGRILTEDRLREVCTEINVQTELWQEICELQRAVPAPLPPFMIGEVAWYMNQHVDAGNPKVTELFRMIVAAAEGAVNAGVGAVPGERIRVYWPDLDGTWPAAVLGPWLAQTYGAVVVNTFQGEAAPYGFIDTTSMDTMLYGIARRCLHEVPMIRQARGSIDVFGEDIRRAVRDYRIDCVLFPGHKGHKDQSASVGFLREICRDADVPLLAFTSDIFDSTWMPIDQVQRRIGEFFEAHGWEPVQVPVPA
jgi:hypothetical protein